MSQLFEDLMQGLNEVEAYLNGTGEGYRVHVPEGVDVKEIRGRLKMTQARFSDAFGFSLDAIKHWEGGRRQPEVAARAYLTVIAKEPEAVMRALGRERVTRRRTKPADAQDVAVSRSRLKEKGTSLGKVKAKLVATGKLAAEQKPTSQSNEWGTAGHSSLVPPPTLDDETVNNWGTRRAK